MQNALMTLGFECGDYIQFLGTAGARFAMAKQVRSSAGVFLNLCGKRLLLDAGPGTLVRCAVVDPDIDVFQLDGIILTHSHIDHSNDVNCLIDAMTGGGLWKRGVVFAPGECLEGDHAVVLRYLRSFPSEIVTLTERGAYALGDVAFRTSCRHDHGVETYGIRIQLPNRNVSFLIDTKFFPQLIDEYQGTDILIVNVVRFSPQDAPHALHLCLDEVKVLVSEIKPAKTILTHFGMTLLKAGPEEQAKRLADDLGCDITAAFDGRIVNI